MKFLIETDRQGKFLYDFSQMLVAMHDDCDRWGIKYDIETCLVEDIQPDGWFAKKFKAGEIETNEYTPVGSVEFVQTFAKLMWGDFGVITPLNVPSELQPMLYSGRSIYNIPSKECAEIFIKELTGKRTLHGRWHVKDANIIKHPDNKFYDVIKDTRNGMMTMEARIGPDGNTCGKVFDHDFADKIVGKQVSSVVPDIVSEWRIFVDKKDIRGAVVGCECYSGDPIAFPRADRIRQFIDAYTLSPDIYTLDVMVDKFGNTWVVECHEFFSCGLYGFEYINYPNMVSRAWFAIRQRIEASMRYKNSQC